MYTPSELTIQFKILKNTFPTFYYYIDNIMTYLVKNCHIYIK